MLNEIMTLLGSSLFFILRVSLNGSFPAPLSESDEKELVKECALHIHTFYENDRGCFGNCQFEKEIFDLLLEYTTENILKVVNMISEKQYNNVVFLWDEKIESKLNSIYIAGGYMERDIIENLERVEKKQYDKDYYVVTFISRFIFLNLYFGFPL